MTTHHRYTLPYRQSLTADAAVVNLYDWNPFYFDFGMMFVKLVAESDEEARPVSQSLLDAFGERCVSIAGFIDTYDHVPSRFGARTHAHTRTQ